MKYGNVGGENGCFMTTNRNISREANTRANMLAQQASGYAIKEANLKLRAF
jgi:RecG-like helicase